MRMRTGIDTLLALTFLPPTTPPPPQSSKLGILSLSSMTGLRVNRIRHHSISILFIKTLGIKCNLWESYTEKEYCISPVLFIYLVRENSRRFATPLQISPPWKVWVTRAKIPYWWSVTPSPQTWAVHMLGRSKFPLRHDQSETLPRSGLWHVISMEFLRSFFRRHFEGKPVKSRRLFSQAIVY